ncbi:hypothetical protein KIPB_012009, partial [Kipferlia bialata]
PSAAFLNVTGTIDVRLADASPEDEALMQLEASFGLSGSPYMWVYHHPAGANFTYISVEYAPFNSSIQEASSPYGDVYTDTPQASELMAMLSVSLSLS